MKPTRAATRYARALVLEASEQDCLEKVNEDMELIKNTFERNIDLKHMVESLVIKNSIKQSSLKLIFKDVNSLSLKLINILFENNRLAIIHSVANKFIEQFKQIKGLQSATVTSAVPLSSEMEKEILYKISSITNKKTTLIKKVDKSLIGGFILRLGDFQFNASFKNKLKNIKQEFNKNTNLLTT